MKRCGSRGWLALRRALAISLGLHALLLLAFGAGLRARGNRRAMPQQLFLGLTPELMDMPTMIDLAAIDTVAAALAPDVVVPPAPTPVSIEPLVAPPGDRTHLIEEAAMRQPEAGADRRKPAVDSGSGSGRPLPERAWRRDRSTLHERLTDGAETNQISRQRTSRTGAMSPQAVRREPLTGLRDSAHTVREQPPLPAAQYGIDDPEAAGEGAPTEEGAARGVVTAAMPAVAEAERPAMDPAQGPLDADRGPRSFDVEARRRTAADNENSRAASREAHPSITELSLSAVVGDSGEGRGASDMPGAAAAGEGQAAQQPGLRTMSKGAADEARTQERLYNRYTQEIGARVNQALVWPRTLAIRLEQGQTVVRFVVLPSGKLGEGARIVKSSGFSEFDQAALDAVRKAAPFPPMRDPQRARPLSVNLPVMFSNPVIR